MVDDPRQREPSVNNEKAPAIGGGRCRVVSRQARRNDQPSARVINAATAGRVLPSRNSRNAPPPVEM